MTTKLRERSASEGSARAARSAASSSVEPLPRWALMKRTAASTFSRVAGCDCGASFEWPPAKRDDVEGIGRTQVRDQAAQQGLRRLNGEAVHRSRDVEDEDVVARDDGGARYARRRLDHREEEALLGAFMQQHARGDLAPGEPILDDDVAVGMLRRRRQRGPDAAFAAKDVKAMRR